MQSRQISLWSYLKMQFWQENSKDLGIILMGEPIRHSEVNLLS